MTNTYQLGSTEYLTVTVYADRTLGSQSVAVSTDNGTTWASATWTGSPATTRKARTNDPITFAARHSGPLLVKINDTPEVPIVLAGYIEVQ